ncbi:MAG TPA: hypothetical protein VHS31_07680, partial [Tepidisphaeraceae bacterium]|nr:hypothetical protein [Tepidisphaeraceae bacterium]
INRSRFLFMSIGLVTGAMVCWWAWKLAGRIGAFAATACYALDPNFLGHAVLVKNDVPLALVTLGLMFAIWRCGRRITPWNLTGIVLALAAAMNVKFSGPIFFVIAFLALLGRALMNESWIAFKWEFKTRVTRLIVPAGVMLVAGIVSFIAIWACYGFRYAPTSDPNLHFDFEAIVNRAKTNIVETATPGLDAPPPPILDDIKKTPTPWEANVTQSLMDHKLLPEAWLHGFFYTYATTLMRGCFLNGRISITGFWYYFPLCLLYKTPTAVLTITLIAFITAIILWMRAGFNLWDIAIGVSLFFILVRLIVWLCGAELGPGANTVWSMLILLPLLVRFIPVVLKSSSQSDAWIAICLAMPVIIYGGLAMKSNFNLGIRHLLPLLPFLHLAVGIVAARLLWRWGKIGALLVGGLGMTLAIESCSAWPNYLAFFNVPSGGWRGGISHLSDSNLDWGQDLILLADWQKNHPDKVLYLCYSGIADPDYYHINHLDLPGGYVFSNHEVMPQQPGILAISATCYQGTYMSKSYRDFYSPLHKVEPREILGGTIYLYDWPLRPPTTQQ